MNTAPDPTPLWSEDVVESRYAGHPGLLYRSSPRTFGEMLAHLGRFRERTFLVQGARRISYGDFFNAVDLAREHFRALGVKPGDRVILLAYNSPDWVLALFALWLMGAVPVPANRWWSSREIEHSISILSPRILLTDMGELPGSVVPGSVDVRPIAELGRFFGQGLRHEPPGDEASADSLDDPALILFTSGSTGMPKAVELSRRSVIVNQHNMLNRARQLPQHLTADQPGVVSLVCTPLFHVGGLSPLITQHLVGGTIVFNEGRFDPVQILELIQNEKVQHFGSVPTMASRVLEHPDFEDYDLSSLLAWPLGGAPVRAELLERMAAKLPQLRRRGLGNSWGMTEAGGFLSAASGRDFAEHPGTVGRPLPVVEVRIADPDDDGVGEVLVRSPAVMLGYVGIDDGTVDSEGWLHSGDLGRFQDGFIFVDGRSKDIVIRGGENISCAQVEVALSTHPAVIEVAAVGLPHPDLGEELAAVVVHRPGSPPPSPEELSTHLHGQVAYFEIPSRWWIRTEPLPTLGGGKIDKKTLVAEFE